MEINIEEYLSSDTMADIAEQEFRKFIQRKLSSEQDMQRFLSNTAYQAVSEACDETLNIDMKELIQKNALRVVNELTSYTVFKSPSLWDDDGNDMWRYLNKCLAEQKPLVAEIVEANVQEATIAELKANMQELIIEAVQNLYKGV